MRMVICGGEALHLSLVKLFRTTLPHARLYNDYGPTEVTVASTGVVAGPLANTEALPQRHGSKRLA